MVSLLPVDPSALSPEVPRERRLHVYCLGAPRTGTHSIARLFSDSYRSAHEPESSDLIFLLLNLRDQIISAAEVRQELRLRDQRLQLEVEANHLLSSFSDDLGGEFPQAKFIITLRDCYSWLESMANQHYKVNLIAAQQPEEYFQFWLHWHQCIFYTHADVYAPEETLLSEHGLPPLENYLRFYVECYQQLFRSIPPERYLVIKTHQLSSSLDQIATFLEIPRHHLEAARAHAGRYLSPLSPAVGHRPSSASRSTGRQGHRDIPLLDRIDAEFLRALVQKHCQELMQEFFPEAEG